MSETAPLVYPVELDSYSEQYSGNYLGVPLPEDIEEIGLSDDDRLHVAIKQEVLRDGEITVLQARKSDTDGRYDFTIQRRDDRKIKYLVALSQEFTEHNPQSPVYGFEEGDEVVVAIHRSEEDERISIYRPGDYRVRMQYEVPELKGFLQVKKLPDEPSSGEDEKTESGDEQSEPEESKTLRKLRLPLSEYEPDPDENKIFILDVLEGPC